MNEENKHNKIIKEKGLIDENEDEDDEMIDQPLEIDDMNPDGQNLSRTVSGF